jgi:DNA-binding transcriptional LysR family regulator
VIHLLAEIEETESLVASSNIVPRGTIRMTCSSSFGVPHLAPAIADFRQQYPEVKFDISTSGRYVDLVEEGLDLAIRIGDIGSPNLTARKIGVMQMMVCASPSYLKRHGKPKHPSDLAGHNCVTYAYSTPTNLWRFHERGAGEGNGDIAVEVGGAVHADTGEMLAAVSAAGAGIVLSPNFVVEPYIASGQLVEVLQPYRTAPYSIYAMYPSRRHLSAKVRTFVDFLATRFSDSSPMR